MKLSGEKSKKIVIGLLIFIISIIFSLTFFSKNSAYVKNDCIRKINGIYNIDKDENEKLPTLNRYGTFGTPNRSCSESSSKVKIRGMSKENNDENEPVKESIAQDRYQGEEVLKSYLNPIRLEREDPLEVVKAIGITSGDSIADIGAGSGYYEPYFSEAVGPNGIVYAIDKDPTAIKFLKKRFVTNEFTRKELIGGWETSKEFPPKLKGKLKLKPPYNNIKIIHNNESDIMLPPDSIDYAFFCQVHLLTAYYNSVIGESQASKIHMLRKFYRTVYEALRDQGILVHIEGNEIPGKILTKEYMKQFGFEFIKDCKGVLKDTIYDGEIRYTKFLIFKKIPDFYKN